MRYQPDHQSASDWVWRSRIRQGEHEWQLHQSAHYRRLFAVSRADTPDRVEYLVQDAAQAQLQPSGYAEIPAGEVFDLLERALAHLRGEDDDE